MSKKTLSLILSLVLVCSLFAVMPLTAGADPKATTWSNASDWAYEELSKAEGEDLIPESLFDKDFTKPITRAEFAGVCVKLYENLSGKTAVAATNNPFTDTGDPDVLKAYNTNLMMGTAPDRFSPGVILNREQAATALTRVLKKCCIPGWTYASDADYTLNFTQPRTFGDDALISDWARQSVYFMAAKEVIKGTSPDKFTPKGNNTREQALVIAVRIVENLKDKPLDYSAAGGLGDGPSSGPNTEAPVLTYVEYFGTAPEAKFALFVIIPAGAFDFQGSYHGSGEVRLEFSYLEGNGTWRDWPEVAVDLWLVGVTAEAIPFLCHAGYMDPLTVFRARLTYRYTDDSGDHSVSSAWSDAVSAEG